MPNTDTNDIGKNARGLAMLEARLPPTVAQIEAGREPCHELPMLVRKAIDAGMPLTAQALQQAVQHVGYEHGAQFNALTKRRKPK